MLGALFREYIVIFSEKWREGNRFSFIDRFPDSGASAAGPYSFIL